MLHQRAGTRSDPSGDPDYAAGGTVRGGVAAVAENGQVGAGVEPAGVGGRRPVDDDVRPLQAEGANPLAGIFDAETQR